MRHLQRASVREREEKSRRAMSSQGLVEYQGKWGTPQQVFEWQQLDAGLVKHKDAWVTREEKEKLEEEEQRKQEEGRRKQEEERKRRRQEEEQRKKEKELYEVDQEKRGLAKFVDRFGQEHWDTPERIEIVRQKDFEGRQRERGLVKYEGEWILRDDMQTRMFKARTSDSLSSEIATYVRKHSSGNLLSAKMLNELITRFWLEEYRPVFNLKLWDRAVASKIRETEGAVVAKYLGLLTNEVNEWAQNRNLTRLTRSDVKLFLASNNMRLSTSFEQMLYREAKLKYRWLPPWKRE
jgi:flagellar biosynthesis GTPase FlhF